MQPRPFARHLTDWIADRRAVLRGGVAALAAAAATPARFLVRDPRAPTSTFRYRSLAQVIATRHAVADGYRAEPLIAWGCPFLSSLPGTGDAPTFDARALTAAEQRQRFGYNNDFLAFLPLPRGSGDSERGLLWVNHEYPSPELMFPGFDSPTAEQVAIMQAAVGGSVVEVRRDGDLWTVVGGSARSRRLHANSPMAFSGPAVASPLLALPEAGEGKPVVACGTLANCAGGKTPWGTVLSAEENFQDYFGGVADYEKELAPAAGEVDVRFGFGIEDRAHRSASRYGWERHDARFDLRATPAEPWRYGWIVEVDPYDPDSVPVKRTALGRFKHEGATCVAVRDGDAWRVVVYAGDDQNDGFLYRFVSRPTPDPYDPVVNRDLLDDGELSVARFDADGVSWIPLVLGQGELVADERLKTQADVLLQPRLAARKVHATPMDRPEDVEVDPVNGRVYVVLTNHKSRATPNVANPRAPNPHGHVLELTPPGGYGADAHHAAERFAWRFFLLAGDPARPGSGAVAHRDSPVWLSCPDNVAFDPEGRLWITSDQGSAQAGSGIPDGVFTCDVDGRGRALLQLFFAGPVGCEVCGPEFTPDGSTLFVAVQHPGEGSTFERPATRWPDFDHRQPPRPSVVAITRRDPADRRVLGS